MRLKSLDDDHAWDEFLYYYRNFIFSIITKMNVAESDCDDLSQKVLLKIWRSIEKFDIKEKSGGFRNWIYTITKNTVLNYIRDTQNDIKRHDQVIISRGEPLFKPEIDVMIKAEWEKYLTALAYTNISKKVSKVTMECFLASLRGETPKETAERLNIAENSAYKYKNRVKDKIVAEIKNLREMLE